MTDALDRRRFLQTTGATVMAATLGSRAVGDEPQPEKKRFLKAVKSGMVRAEGDWTAKFKLLKELGYDGVDVSQRIPREEVLKAKEETGLVVHGTVGYDHWRVPLSHPKLEERKRGLELYVECLKDAHAYGGSSCLLVPAVVNKSVSYEDAYKRSQEMIREAIPVAEELEIDILLENVWNNFLLSPVETARYIDELESERLGAYFDVGNVVRYGWPEQWIRTLGKRVKKLDVKEYSRKIANQKGPGAGFGVEIGDGDCDWPAVVKACEDVGFSGWCTAEVGGGGKDRLADIKKRMDRVLPG